MAISNEKLTVLQAAIKKANTVDDLLSEHRYQIAQLSNYDLKDLNHLERIVYQQASDKNFLIPIVQAVRREYQAHLQSAKGGGEAKGASLDTYYISSYDFEALKKHFYQAFSERAPEAKVELNDGLFRFSGLDALDADKFLRILSADDSANFTKIERQADGRLRITKIITHKIEVVGDDLLEKIQAIEEFSTWFTDDGYYKAQG